MTSRVKDNFISVNDKHRHYINILRWLGYKSMYIEVEHNKRMHGKSSYSFFKLLNHAIDGIISQSYKPLLISVYLGFFMVFLSFVFIIVLIYFYLVQGFKEGWLSTVLLIIFFSGFNMLFIGLNGLYLGKNFEETRERPLYIETDKINF